MEKKIPADTIVPGSMMTKNGTMKTNGISEAIRITVIACSMPRPWCGVIWSSVWPGKHTVDTSVRPIDHHP